MRTKNLIAVLVLIVGLGGQTYAAESPANYMEWARRGLVLTGSIVVDSAEVDTLVTFDLGGQEASWSIIDSTREEHNVGAEYWTLCVRVRNPLARIDSLWVEFTSEAGNGPMMNPDGSMLLIDDSSTGDTYGIWGVYRFATQDTTVAWRMYKLPIPRARGVAKIKARGLHTLTRIQWEIWKGSDR